MNCERAIELISARVDGELAPADEAALDAHLAGCPACAATAEAFELQDADMRHAFDERRHLAGTVVERVREHLPRHTHRWKRLRRRARPFLFVAALAAAVGGLVWLLGVHTSSHVPPKHDAAPEPLAGLTPKPRPTPAAAQPLAVGQTLRTGPGERRRVGLPDGSVLYINQDTTIALDRARHLALSAGEVYVEVTPVRDGVGPFVVQTPKREVTAVGTKFAVRADAGVLVTQGSVQASGLNASIPAGRELTADGTLTDAPRASYLLDWTRDLMAEADTPLVPGSEFGGGALVAVDPYGEQAKLSLRQYHVDVHVEDGFARTTIDQTYFNHANSRLEGTFYFPLPPDASLSRLAMYVDGRLMEGGMVERDFGRQVYEKIVTSQRDPALLEWVDGSTFKMRVFPLEARQEKRIVLSYTQRLAADYGRMTYRFPAGHSLEVVQDWSFHARVKDALGFRAVASPSHPDMQLAADGKDLLLDAAERNTAVNRDVVLHLSGPGPAGSDVARFSAAEVDGSRYLMLRYRPTLEARNGKPADGRTWVFLFESSGDRDPLLARTQIEVLRALLGNAEHDDTFAILAAGTNVSPFATAVRPVTPENVQAGLDFLDKVHLIGALDLGKALGAAEQFLGSAKNPYLVHVGSGVAAMGERRDDVLAKRIPEGTRYVGVGVGRRWNRGFMKAAAERTGGYFTQINPDEPVSWRGFELYSALTMPRLLDIKVTDDAGRQFLTCAGSITAGEEVCAALRLDADDPRPPQLVKVTGSLAGQPFERVLSVHDVTGNAGYLPRTWAKLQIERLLADDIAGNREQIIALSKAMYVMTPFTSLLVLENEQMYREHKVDRGRKDHWAMYPCPEKIPVIYEPDPNSPAGTGPSGEQKPTEQQVLQTILVRVPPRWLQLPNDRNGPGGTVATALQLYGGAYAVPDGEMDEKRLGELEGREQANFFGDLALGRAMQFGIETGLAAPKVPVDLLERAGLQAALAPEPSKASAPYLREAQRAIKQLRRTEGLADRLSASRGRKSLEEAAARQSPTPLRLGLPITLASGSVQGLGYALEGKPASPGRGDTDWAGYELARPVPAGGLAGISFVNDPQRRIMVLNNQSENLRQVDSEMERFWMVDRLAVLRPERVHETFGGDDGVTALGVGRSARALSRGEPRLYRRPSFSGDERVFTDLACYAPGMNTSAADIRAVLEAEAAPRLADLSGRIDPAARKLIDRARAAGWQTLTFKDKDGKALLTLALDGAGRHVYEHTLSGGLKERVVCDGRTLLHLYPDLGFGARRTVSRFHRAELAAIVPWLVLPADDLARGADVTAVDEHTVAVSPRGAALAKGDDGKPALYLRHHLVFGDDGRLSERRLVLMPEGKTLARETYAADGIVKRLDGEGKEVATLQSQLSPAPAPELTPDTSAVVVLPLPLRSREVVYRKLGFDPNKPLHVDENGCHLYLDEDAALELFATEYASQNPGNARTVYRDCFERKEARVAGFHVLLSSCGERSWPLPDLMTLRAERPSDPLLLYLTLLNMPWYRTGQPYLGLDTAGELCKGHPFLGTLAAFRDQWLVWQVWHDVDASRSGWLRERQRRGLEFVRSHKGTALGWALLGLLDDNTADADQRFHRELADACGLFADHPALGYPARYERARALLHGGRRDEARALFREMFSQAVKAGVLPAIDSTFREALQGETNDADQWTEMMRQTASAFCTERRRPAAVALAWQCWQLDDRPLASNLLAAALDGIADEDERLLTTLSAVGFLSQTGQHADADARLRPLLEDAKLAGQPALWRVATRIADARGLTARSIECLERALALEYQNLPDVINLEEVRRDYGRLLDHYASLARAASAMRIDPPRDLLARTVRAADCWRALDRDEAAKPCEAAAEILRSLGAADLAWEYVTTPIGQKPNESGPWLALARTLNREGDFALADRAYAAAYEAEPTNAQLLWDRAQSLRQSGRAAEAQKLLRQIVDGDWQPRFAWIRSQAKWQLEGR